MTEIATDPVQALVPSGLPPHEAEDDRALARMLGLAMIAGIGIWVAIAIIVF